MYLNVVSFRNGKTLGFTSELPYSIDKTAEDWSVVKDEKTGQIMSFRGSEVVAISTIEHKEEKPTKAKKDGIKMSVTKE